MPDRADERSDAASLPRSYRVVSIVICGFAMAVFLRIGTRWGGFAAGLFCAALVLDLGALSRGR